MKAFDDTNYPHSELTGRIIAAATAVHSELRPGLDEVLYERAICIEFAERSIHFDQQKVFPAHYKTRYIGDLIPDLIVESKVIVDLKVVEAFNETHIAQMLGYLNITRLEVGLLINFKHAALQIKRIVNQPKREP
ncbi:MAG: GxxExxY protein [Akkermansiaceae bacterium]|nr:GxxExxY protein [Akkermansiaceae bacterium]MCF7732277.1 GxxExxY protein [Akkermansiaceae bacterium]